VQASAVADVNGDKNADIITAYGSTDFNQFRTGFLEVFTSDGHGHFTKTNKLALPEGTSTYLAVHDFNGDGKPDIAVLNEFAAIGGFFDNLTIFLNHGDGTFMQGSVTSFAAAAGGGNQMVTGDFNGDGKFDLAYLCALGKQMFTFNGICTFNNTGNGTFIAGPSYLLEMPPFSLATADLNGDKRWDLVVGLSNNEATPPPPNRLVTLLAKQTGNFFWYAAASTPTIPFFPTLADFNGDGKLDVATSAEGIAVLALFGDGKGRFSGQQSYKAFSGPLDVGPLSKGNRPSVFFGVGTTSPRLQELINKNQ
jgi:FG-GAP-like repeat